MRSPAQILDPVKHNPQIRPWASRVGTPFADEGTKTWLKEEQAKVGGGGGGGGGGPASSAKKSRR